MTKITKEQKQTEKAEEQASAKKMLPRLLARRQEMEREAGAFGRTRQHHMTVLIVLASIAAIVGIYALWTTVTGSASVIAWVVAGVLGAGAALLNSQSKHLNNSKSNEMDELHTQMATIGRQIDRVEKRTRN